MLKNRLPESDAVCWKLNEANEAPSLFLSSALKELH